MYQGRPAHIVKAFYGIQSSGRSFWDQLAGYQCNIGFVGSKADPDR